MCGMGGMYQVPVFRRGLGSHPKLLAQELREELGMELADDEQEDAVFLLLANVVCQTGPVCAVLAWRSRN
ncbi:hypothetical protein D3C81_414390 [compost metagenome]